MALDRIVYWAGKAPRREHLAQALRDYLGAFAADLRWDAAASRFMALLVGQHSEALRHVPGGAKRAGVAQRASAEVGGERWFEVYVGSRNIDVITRHQDDATNALAEGFAKLCARFWGGRLEQG